MGGRPRRSAARAAVAAAALLTGGAALCGMAAASGDPPAEVEIGALFALHWKRYRENAGHFRLAIDM